MGILRSDKETAGHPGSSPSALGMNAVTPGCDTRGRGGRSGPDPQHRRPARRDDRRVGAARARRWSPAATGRERLLGRGGAKEVWLAHDLTLERPVAIARALAGAAGEQVRERMRREARLMARLGDHPHVVTVFDAFDDGGQLHIVARYMEGGSLAARARRRARRPDGGARRAAHRPHRRRRARPRARARRRAPRRQARQHLARAATAPPASATSASRSCSATVESAGHARPARRTTSRPSRPRARRRSRRPTSTRSARRSGSCSRGRPPFTGPDALALLAAHRYAEPEPPSRHAPGIPPALDALAARDARQAAGGPPGERGRRARPARPAGRRAERARRRRGRRPRAARRPRRRARPPARRARRDGARAARRVVAVARRAGDRQDAAGRRGGRGGRAPAAPRSCAAAPSEESRAYGPWRAALRPLVAAASGLPADVLADVRRLTGDGRPPEARRGSRRTARRSGCGCSTRSPRWRALGRGRAAARDRARGPPRRRPLVARAARHVVGAAPDARLLVVRHPPPRRARRRATRSPRRSTRSTATAGWSGCRCGGLDADGRRSASSPARGPATAAGAARAHRRQPVLPARARPAARRARDARRRRRRSCPRSCPTACARSSAAGSRRSSPRRARCSPSPGVVARPFTIAGVARVGRMDREAVALALEPALAGRIVEPRARRARPLRLRPRDRPRRRLRRAHARRARARLHAAVAALLEESLAAGGDATAAEAARHALAAARCGGDPGPAWALSLEAAREAAGAAGARRGRRALRRRAGGARAGRGGVARPAARDVARARRRALRRRRHRGAPGAASAPPPRPPAALGARRRPGARRARLLRGPGLRRDRRRGDRAAPGRARRAAARRQRAARPRARPARPAARPRHRHRALRGAASTRASRWRAASATPTRSSASSPPPRSSTGGRSAPPSRAAAIDEVLALTVRSADPAAVFWARTLRLRDALEAGDAATAAETSSAGSSGWPRRAAAPTTAGACSCCRPAVALFAGRLDEGERLAEEAVELNRRHGDDADQEHTVQRLALALERRDPHDRAPRRAARLRAALPAAARAGRRCSPAPSTRSGTPTRRAPPSPRCARDGFAELLRTPDRLCGLVLLAEPVAAHGDARAASSSSPRRSPRTSSANAIMDAAWAAFGPVERAAGIARRRGRPRRTRRPRTSRAAAELAARWGAPAWELAALADWAASGAPGAPRDRLAALARELRLPHAPIRRRRRRTPRRPA